MKSLTDLTEASHQSTGEDVRGLVQVLVKNQERCRNTRAAIVVSTTVSYGMSRMLQLLMGELPEELSVFYDPYEAKEWLGVT